MITTFYAGTGVADRSSLVAAVALQLARWRYRTLCVDWDLAGPGVTGQFIALLAEAPDWGTVDLVRDVGETRTPDRYVLDVPEPGADGQLHLLPARGRRSPSDPRPVDWIGLHRERHLGEYLESCAERWRHEYDAVLIDAPSGTGPGPGVCVAHLPDALALLIPPDGVEAAAELVARVDRARDRLPYDRSRLLVVPCVTTQRAGAADSDGSWPERSGALAAVFGDWAAREVPVSRLARALTLDRLGGPPDGALRTLAALVAQELGGTELLLTERTTQEYVTRATSAPGQAITPRPELEVHRRAARALEEVLLGILPPEEWASIERSVLAMSAALEASDVPAVGEAAEDIAILTVRSSAPDLSGIPADLRSLVERILRILRPAPRSPREV